MTMKAETKFQKQPKTFWAQIKLVSMTLGYSKKGQITTYTVQEIADCLESLGLNSSHLIDSKSNKPSAEGSLLVEYFKYRSKILHKVAEPNLMNRDEAKKEFDAIYKSFESTVNIPFNKQKGAKRHHAYLTGIVSLLTEKTLKGVNFDPDPRKAITVSKNNKPVQTLTRRVDGAYPQTTNPVAIWEIKEYYGTTTFGSRVADGVYETMLDGYEIEELSKNENIDIKHYFIIDDYFTWWDCGKSYLCRMIDMVHEGHVDEVLFGKEVIKRWPSIVKSWPKALPSK
jgi:hypothetical protein